MSEENITANLDQFLNSLIELTGLELSAEINENPETVSVELIGEDVSMLLGHNGEVLNAFEYLSNKVFGRKLPPESKIVFDAAGFRSKRERELQLMAQYAAERVRASKQAFTFEPMSPGERRIVHLALAAQEGVRTESQGEGEDRKVMVLPAS
jgi:spoIIIJ-associated protein